VLLNRICSGYGRFANQVYRIVLRDNSNRVCGDNPNRVCGDNPNCVCGDNPNCVCGDIQTSQHVLNCDTIGIRGNIKTVDEDFHF